MGQLAINNQQEAQYQTGSISRRKRRKTCQYTGHGLSPNATGPKGGQASNIAGIPQRQQPRLSGGGPIQRGLGPQGAITSSYGPTDNFSADRQRVEDSLMARMNPQLQIEQQRVQQQLADQGIRYGSQCLFRCHDELLPAGR